jgi:hypothetical protein
MEFSGITFTNNTLAFSVTGFSTYEAVENPNTGGTTPPSGGSGGGGGGGGGGGTTPRINVTGNITSPAGEEEHPAPAGEEQAGGISGPETTVGEIAKLPKKSRVLMIVGLILLMSAGIIYSIYLAWGLIKDYRERREFGDV